MDKIKKLFLVLQNIVRGSKIGKLAILLEEDFIVITDINRMITLLSFLYSDALILTDI